jgi:hypothetical protein
MAIHHANRGIVKKDLQLYYNREFSKSFRGEATTNIVSNTTDFSGLSYAGYDSEWTSNPTRFTKSYNSTLQTPIGTGATLLTESGTAGYHHLSRFGGSDEGGNSISCYVYPVNGNITNFAIGMLGDGGSTTIFNLVTGTVVSTGVRVSNAFITKVSAWSGWYRVGANIGGRSGGWVGAVGLDVQTSYTPSLPYKSMYVTGMQYESKTYCTPFVVGSNRSANTVAAGGGLLDISGNNVNADLTNVSFNSSGYFFNGSSNYIDLGSDVTFKTSGGWSVSSWFNLTQVNSGNLYNFIGASAITYNSWYWTVYQSNLALWNMSPGGWYYGSTTIQANTWYNAVLVCSYDGTKYQMYLNGVAEGGTHTSYTWNSDYSGLKVGYIGRGDSSNGRYFYGAYPDFKIYRKELTAAEVLQNFNATRKTYGI